MAPTCRGRFRQAWRLIEEYRVRVASTPQETKTRAPAIWGRSPTSLRRGKPSFNLIKRLARHADGSRTRPVVTFRFSFPPSAGGATP